MTETQYAWKALDGTRSCNGGDGEWSRPHSRNRPGRWMPKLDSEKLEACKYGYHVCRDLNDLLRWLGPDIWVCEWRGESVVSGDKLAVQQARLVRHVEAWNERTARLFAADCAEHVLPIWEREYPDDRRPRKAIEAARAFADSQITMGELDAARSAAGAAARSAGAAAKNAAWYAALAAARSARSAARNAERAWQTEQLRNIVGTLP